MSLEQNDKKIKSIIQFFVCLEIVLILYLFTYIYNTYNRGEGPEFLLRHFEVDFLTSSSVTSEKNTQENQNSATDLNIVASVNGIRYYYLHCSGVGRIRDENRVYFASEKEAEEAGYTLAINCKK